MTHTRINIPTVLLSLADEHAYRLFQRVAAGQIHHDELRTGSSELTKKQYYSRLSRLINSGLIARRDGVYSLTAFGKVVLNSMTQVERAVNDVWKFKALVSIEGSEGFPSEEQQKIAELLLGKGVMAVPYEDEKVSRSVKG